MKPIIKILHIEWFYMDDKFFKFHYYALIFKFHIVKIGWK
jgi:hypothetical protein